MSRFGAEKWRQGVTEKVWKRRGNFFYLANVLSNAPAARERMVRGAASSRAPPMPAAHCVKTFGL